MIKMTFRASITAAMLVVLLCLSGTEALMARVTCHCDTGDVPGVCMSASARTKSKVMSKASANAGCNVLCGTEEEVLRRCENAAGMHVGDITCTGFSVKGCAMSCSDGCEHGCEAVRERNCAGVQVGV